MTAAAIGGVVHTKIGNSFCELLRIKESRMAERCLLVINMLVVIQILAIVFRRTLLSFNRECTLLRDRWQKVQRLPLRYVSVVITIYVL